MKVKSSDLRNGMADVRSSMTMGDEHINCPNCAADLVVPAQAAMVKCRDCNQTFSVERDEQTSAADKIHTNPSASITLQSAIKSNLSQQVTIVDIRIPFETVFAITLKVFFSLLFICLILGIVYGGITALLKSSAP